MNPLFVNSELFFSYTFIKRKDLYLSQKGAGSLTLAACSCCVLREHSILYITALPCNSLFNWFMSTVPVPANAESSHRICSVDSAQWILLEGLFFLSYVYYRHPFLSSSLCCSFLSTPRCLCLSVSLSASDSLTLFLSGFIFLSVPSLLSHMVSSSPSELLPSPSFSLFFFFSLSLLTLLTISSSVCLWLSVPPKWGFRIRKIEIAKHVTHQPSFSSCVFIRHFQAFLLSEVRVQVGEWVTVASKYENFSQKHQGKAT